jgi:hypothetical protein
LIENKTCLKIKLKKSQEKKSLKNKNQPNRKNKKPIWSSFSSMFREKTITIELPS